MLLGKWLWLGVDELPCALPAEHGECPAGTLISAVASFCSWLWAMEGSGGAATAVDHHHLEQYYALNVLRGGFQ
jgi:hypothetical protein